MKSLEALNNGGGERVGRQNHMEFWKLGKVTQRTKV